MTTKIKLIENILNKFGSVVSFDYENGIKIKIGKLTLCHPTSFVESEEYLALLEKEVELLHSKLARLESNKTTHKIDIPVFDTAKDLSNSGGFANKYYNNSTGVKIPVFNN